MYWVGLWNIFDLYCWPGDDTTTRDIVYSVIGGLLVGGAEVWTILSARTTKATWAADADERFERLLQEATSQVQGGGALTAAAIASLAGEEALSMRPRYEREYFAAEDYSLRDAAEDSSIAAGHHPGMRFNRPGNMRPPDTFLADVPPDAIDLERGPVEEPTPGRCCSLSKERKGLFVELGKGLVPDMMSILMMTGFWNILDLSLPFEPSLERELAYFFIGLLVFCGAFLGLDDHICLPPREGSLLEIQSRRVTLSQPLSHRRVTLAKGSASVAAREPMSISLSVDKETTAAAEDAPHQ
jgi:hypothetical protein